MTTFHRSLFLAAGSRSGTLERREDVLWVPQRGYIGRLDPVFKGLGNIVEAQLVQCATDRIEVLVVPDRGYDTAMNGKLVHNLRSKLGDELAIEVCLVNSIPRGPNGKFRAVVSDIASPAVSEML